jgi:hypothetical protein
MRPCYFLLSTAERRKVLGRGATRLGFRKAAAWNTWALFEEAESGRKINRFKARGKTYMNNEGERAVLAKYLPGSSEQDKR